MLARTISSFPSLFMSQTPMLFPLWKLAAGSKEVWLVKGICCAESIPVASRANKIKRCFMVMKLMRLIKDKPIAREDGYKKSPCNSAGAFQFVHDRLFNHHFLCRHASIAIAHFHQVHSAGECA